MPGLLLLIAGIVLMTVGSSWFTGAATVGLIILLVSFLPIALFLLLAIFGISLFGGAKAIDSRNARKRRSNFR